MEKFQEIIDKAARSLGVPEIEVIHSRQGRNAYREFGKPPGQVLLGDETEISGNKAIGVTRISKRDHLNRFVTWYVFTTCASYKDGFCGKCQRRIGCFMTSPQAKAGAVSQEQ
jgi:hypothetical protein